MYISYGIITNICNTICHSLTTLLFTHFFSPFVEIVWIRTFCLNLHIVKSIILYLSVEVKVKAANITCMAEKKT